MLYGVNSMPNEQPPTIPLTDLERYYEAMYMRQHSKPGSLEEAYWSRKAEELEWVTKLLPKQ
jgi:hypothetical protein